MDYNTFSKMPFLIEGYPKLSSIGYLNIANMLPIRYLLIPGFRDIPGIQTSLINRIKKDNNKKLILSAVKKGVSGIVKHLLESDADKEITDIFGRTPILQAVQKDFTIIVKLLLDAGANKEVKDEGGMTCLHWASNIDIVKLLLDAGANKNIKSNSGDTPLHFAAEYGNTDITKILLNFGADKNVVNNFGKTPLDLAIRERHTEIIDMLK